ncbi:MAG: UDP-galactopyranose mutase [Coriobacteriia bacterium]|nr:UDP-galactopyranose mutase [Coriobacteriia bacterium]
MNVVVVGCGFSGAVVAREIAEHTQATVHIIEKRPHIAGNMFDKIDENGIMVQHYGPHMLITNNYSVVEYLQRFSGSYQFFVKILSEIDGKYVRLPFNFLTLQQLIGAKKAAPLLDKMRREFSGKNRVSVLDICNSSDQDISSYGELLFDKAYRPYCAKQWGLDANTIDRSVLDRVMMSMGYDERYIDRDFQYMFNEGFTKLFENMLDLPNISIELETDAQPKITLVDGKVKYNGEVPAALVFTGAVDELFGLKYGTLPYRSLDIRYEWFDNDDVLPEMITSHPQAEGFVRKTEYRKLMKNSSNAKGSVVATEYPVAYTGENGQTPYYPVLTSKTRATYDKYKVEAESYENLYLCGRLAEFKYYNMDDCIINALSVAELIRRDLHI